MGVADWFQTLASNLQVKATESISYRYKRITKALNVSFRSTDSETANSFYTGSYGRNTAVEGFSDLDMIYQLPVHLYEQYNKHVGNGQSALLQAVRKAIQTTYPTTDLGADGQVVVINFDDNMVFEIVPAFLSTTDTYIFPNANSGGSWKTTDPKPEIAAIQARNNETNGNLSHLCRMLRAWKAACSVDMGGLLIDTLAYQCIENWGYRDKAFLYHDFMARDFFEFAKNQDDKQSIWKAPGSGQHVNGGGFQYKAKLAYNLSVAAIKHQGKSEDWAAKQKWRDIFGTVFPPN